MSARIVTTGPSESGLHVYHNTNMDLITCNLPGFKRTRRYFDEMCEIRDTEHTDTSYRDHNGCARSGLANNSQESM